MSRRVSLIACVTAAALLLCLRTRASQGSSPAAMPVQIIVVSSQEEAEQVLDQLNRPVSFSALAREKSLNPTAHEGGYLGRVDPSTAISMWSWPAWTVPSSSSATTATARL